MATPKYVFKAPSSFWKAFSCLTSEQQSTAREAFKKFQANPFDPSFKTHKINRLSALNKCTIYGISLAPDLRSVFKIDGNIVISLDIGNHDIYK